VRVHKLANWFSRQIESLSAAEVQHCVLLMASKLISYVLGCFLATSRQAEMLSMIPCMKQMAWHLLT